MKEKAKIALQILILMMLSFFVTMGFKVHYDNTVSGSLTVSYVDSFCFTDILIFIVAFGLLGGVYLLIKRYYKNIQKFLIMNENYKMKPLYIWLIVTVILLVVWLPYLLSFAPGAVLGDSFSSIEQNFTGIYSNHHPLLYTLLVGFFVKIGVFLGNINIGIFLYSCFQYYLLAMTLGYVITFLAKNKVKKIPLGLVVAFFALCPIFPSYAIIMWKDPIFSMALLFLGLLLFNFAKNNFQGLKWYHYGLLTICTLAVAFFRNNGIYILILLIPIFYLLFRKPALKTSLTMLGALVVALVIQGPIYSVLNIHKPSVEAFGVPLQQIAYVISTNEDSFTSEEKEFLGEIMPLESWKRAYTPLIVDSIKWNEDFSTEFFESHLKEFLKIWALKIPSNFGGYVKAYLLETLGFWHPYYQNTYGYIDQYIAENDYGVHGTDLIQKTTGLSVREKIKSSGLMIGSGLLAFVMFFSLVLTLNFQKKRMLILYLTSALCWGLIMISTPVAFSLRYVFVLTLTVPIFIFCPFFRIEKINKLKKNDIIKK